jgi:hypothetical protein
MGFARPKPPRGNLQDYLSSEGSNRSRSQALKSFAFTYKTFSAQNPHADLFHARGEIDVKEYHRKETFKDMLCITSIYFTLERGNKYVNFLNIIVF